jgi:hypothetical protein
MSSVVHHTNEGSITFEALSDNMSVKDWLVVKGVGDMPTEDFLVIREQKESA